MGYQNIVRVLTEAGLAGELLDLGADGTLKVLPNQDNTHSIEVGNGTKDMSFKVFLGDANTYFLLDRPTSSMQLQNVSFSLSDLSVNTATINTLTVNDWMNTGPLIVGGDLAVTGSLNAASINAPGTSVLGDVSGSNLTVTNILNSEAVVANTVTISGAWNPPSINTGSVQANTLNTVNATVTGAFSASTVTATSVATNTLIVIPTTDDGTPSVFGSATKSSDVKIFLGGTNIYAQFDRGSSQFTLKGVNFFTDAAVVVNAAITASGTLSAGDISTGDITLTGNTQAASLNTNALVTTDITGTGLTVIPAVDDTGVITVGNATHAGDVKIFLGGASTFALFDKGNAKLQLSGVDLDTNAAIVSTGGTSTFATINTNTITVEDLTVSNSTTINSDAYWVSKYSTVTANATLNATQFGGLVTCNPAGSITLTLPTPVGNEGVWMDFQQIGAGDTTLRSVNSTSQLLAIVGNSLVNTAKIDAYGEFVRVTSNNTKWVVSPYEGTTLTTT